MWKGAKAGVGKGAFMEMMQHMMAMKGWGFKGAFGPCGSKGKAWGQQGMASGQKGMTWGQNGVTWGQKGKAGVQQKKSQMGPEVDMTGAPGPNGEDPSTGRWSFQSKGKNAPKRWKWKKNLTDEEYALKKGLEYVPPSCPETELETAAEIVPRSVKGPKVDRTGEPGPNGEDPSTGRWSLQSKGRNGPKRWKWKKNITDGEHALKTGLEFVPQSIPETVADIFLPRTRGPEVDRTGEPGPNGEDPSTGRWSFQSKGRSGLKRWKWKPNITDEEFQRRQAKRALSDRLARQTPGPWFKKARV